MPKTIGTLDHALHRLSDGHRARTLALLAQRFEVFRTAGERDERLVVLPRDVVHRHDRREPSVRHMGPMVVVAMEPALELGGA